MRRLDCSQRDCASRQARLHRPAGMQRDPRRQRYLVGGALDAEVAQDDAERDHGLQHREVLADARARAGPEREVRVPVAGGLCAPA